MKIVFVNNMLKNGGAEVSLCRIANLLCGKGHDIRVITIAQEKNHSALLDSRIHYSYVVSDSSSANALMRLLLKGFNFIKRHLTIKILTFKLNRCQADVAITFNEFEKCLIPLVRCRAGKKVCWFRHDITDYYLGRRIVEVDREKFTCLFEGLDQLLFVTEASKDNFCKCFPEFQNKSAHFLNSIDIQAIAQLSQSTTVERDNNKLIFLCLARIAKEKGQDLLLEAAHRLEQSEHRNEFEIWLVGGGSCDCFDSNPADLITTNVKEFGFMDNPYPFLKAADVLVVPSRSEGCPNVILEAMALGKPIVSTKTSGGIEILHDGEYGLLCDINAESLFYAMKKMFNQEMYEHYRKAAEEEGKKHGNDVFADSLNRYLEKLIKE